MKAIVYTQYGPPDVLQLQEVAKPEAKEDQVLVKVRAASVNALDYRRFENISSMGRFMEERLVKSIGKVLGADIAGVVDAVGELFHRAEGLEGNPVLACEWFVVLVCGEHDLVATEPQFERQAQHGENITGTAKRRANELHGVTLNSFRSRTWPSRFLISTAMFKGFLVKVSRT